MVRPERFELPTSWFVARRSIQLSYGRKRKNVAEREGLLRASMHSALQAIKRSLSVHLLFKFVPTNLSNPRGFKYHPTKSLSNERARSPFIRKWRRERDSNPRWAFDPYALSRGAPSTTRPSLRSLTGQFRIEGYGSRKQLAKARGDPTRKARKDTGLNAIRKA